MVYPGLQAQDLGFHPPLSHRPFLQGVSLQVEPGQVQWVVGATGSGKTLALKLLSGLLAPTTGCLSFQGRSIEDWDLPSWRRSIVYLASQPQLLGLSVAENLAYPLQLQKLETTTQIDRQAEILELLQLSPQILSATAPLLSRFQHQQVALARALMLHPALILLDNPFAGWPAAEVQPLWSALQTWVQAQRLGVIWAMDELPSCLQGDPSLATAYLLHHSHWTTPAALGLTPDDLSPWLQAEQAAIAAEWGEWEGDRM
ncbi:MAG: ATP-binding cassette domain-containing protein [Prochlorothrix sp.]